MDTDSYAQPSGTFNIRIEGDDYLVRVIRPSSSTSLHELQLSLKRNRQMLADSFEAMKEACRDDFFKRIDRKDVDYLSPTQNALVARANIDVLIPLINMKGGVATYENKKEALPLEKHIQKLRSKAAEKVREEEGKNSLYGFLMMLVVIALMGGLLYLFL